MKKDIGAQFLCKDCEYYNSCEYYHNRKRYSYICKNFHLPNKLDKIRAEIDEQYDRVHPYNISCAEGLEMALGIIDKYKAESKADS